FPFTPQCASKGVMTLVLRLPARLLMLAALSMFALVQPAAAQTVLRDAETERLLQDLVDPLAEAAGLQRGAVDVVLVSDPSIKFPFTPHCASKGVMTLVLRLPARLLMLAALAMFALVQPAAAQTVLRDAETERLLQDLVDPLAEAAGLQRGAADVVLVSDPSI